jgi:membrane protein implicated in regulation of membrane protease activity
MEAIYWWLLASIVLIVIELATMSLTTIWFAGGAIVAFFMSLFHCTPKMQWIVFVVVSLILLILTRPIAVKFVKGQKTRTNVDAIVGTRVLVTETIDNAQSTGAVSVNGQIWTARAAIPEQVLHKDEWVSVKNVQGVKLIVGMEGEK